MNGIGSISARSLFSPITESINVAPKNADKKVEGKAFLDLLQGMDKTQNSAQSAVYNLLTKGEGEVHEVLIQQQKAESQMKTAAVIRDNLTESYKQLMSMQI